MMSKYTPAPWNVRFGVCRNDHPDISADVQGANGQFVADCGCHEWANANARLIAAAPDLLEALELIKSRAGGCQLEAHDPNSDEPVPEFVAVNEIYEWAKEAIEKATGR